MSAAVTPPTFSVVLKMGGRVITTFEFNPQPDEKCVIDLNLAEVRRVLDAYDTAAALSEQVRKATRPALAGPNLKVIQVPRSRSAR